MTVYCSPLTNDTLFDGRLVCRQYRLGYRFSVDAVLAAHFCRVQDGDHILDLGCGCGVIGLILAYRHQGRGVQVAGLEFQPDLAMLSHDNVLANNMESSVSIIEGDLRRIEQFVAPESMDMVVCNPPYRKPGAGRLSPGNQRARARHEVDSCLEEVVDAAAFAVRNRGRVVFVYPADRSVFLLHCLKLRNLEPKRIQPVYSYPGIDEACLVLVEAVKNGGEEARITAPFYIYTEKNGPYTDQMKELYT
ncbi:MAG: methyltransferase [Desulfobulbaceae bacterium]|nr:methyltransferase [Desulfobulbaceae bacterium]